MFLGCEGINIDGAEVLLTTGVVVDGVLYLISRALIDPNIDFDIDILVNR